MGDLDVVALNRVLKWIGLEMTSPQEVRVLADPSQGPYVRKPQTLVGVFTDPAPNGGYALSRTPQLDRIVRSFAPLGTSVWTESPLPSPAEKRAILDTVRTQMQIPGADASSRHGRILATTLYWNAVKSLRLSPSEARREAATLRGIIETRKQASDQPSQEIARNAALALAVLIEAYPNAK
ncbi:MAG TPA: hypothetical protein VFX30_04035 [bacterium]|nr:hypothetical protein [bacterium]